MWKKWFESQDLIAQVEVQDFLLECVHVFLFLHLFKNKLRIEKRAAFLGGGGGGYDYKR